MEFIGITKKKNKIFKEKKRYHTKIQYCSGDTVRIDGSHTGYITSIWKDKIYVKSLNGTIEVTSEDRLDLLSRESVRFKVGDRVNITARRDDSVWIIRDVISDDKVRVFSKSNPDIELTISTNYISKAKSIPQKKLSMREKFDEYEKRRELDDSQSQGISD